MRLNNSLIMKLMLPIPVIILMCLAIAWFVVPNMVLSNARDAAKASALQTAKQFKTIRGYYTKNIVAKAKKSGAMKPSIHHKGVDGAIPLPATFIQDLSKLMEKENTTLALYSAFPFPNRKERVLDDFQKQAWKYLSKHPDEVFSRQETSPKGEVLRVAISDKMAAKGCVSCHNSHPLTPKNDWKLGDVRGVLEIDSNISVALASANDLKNNILIGVLLAGIIIFAVVFLGARAISGPVKEITYSMQKIADGELSTEVPGEGRQDEIGLMAKALDIFRKKLLQTLSAEKKMKAEQAEKQERQLAMKELTSDFTGRIGDIVNSVSSASTQLNSTAITMEETSDEASNLAVAVSAASEQAAANVQSVAAASGELSGSISEIGARVEEASVASKQAVEEVEATSRHMEGLAETTNKISEVVKMISGIADQTNLLALNATIESARAGEAGKGFAVVANEVKALASQTAKATEDIVKQIEEVQAAATMAATSMTNISEVISRVDDASSSIASAIEEQGAVTGEIARNVEEAAAGTDDVARNIAGVTKAANNTGEASTHVLSAATELSDQAERLKREVNGFINEVKVS